MFWYGSIEICPRIHPALTILSVLLDFIHSFLVSVGKLWKLPGRWGLPFPVVPLIEGRGHCTGNYSPILWLDADIYYQRTQLSFHWGEFELNACTVHLYSATSTYPNRLEPGRNVWVIKSSNNWGHLLTYAFMWGPRVTRCSVNGGVCIIEVLTIDAAL